MLEQFLFTLGYVTILAIVAVIYHSQGYKRGMNDTLISFKQFEPEALARVIARMEKDLKVNAKSES